MKALVPCVVATTLFLAACPAQETLIRGRAENARGRPDVFWPLPQGTIAIYGQEGDAYASTTTDLSGNFRTFGPSGQTVFATVTGTDLATSSFTGITGAANAGPLVVALDEHQDSPLYGVLLSDIDALRAEFEGCPGVDDAGGIVFGEVRVIGITDPVTDEEPLVTTAEASMVGVSDQEFAACYLNDAGDAYDPDALVTGETGRFAIFGVPAGLWTLSVSYSAFVESNVETFSQVFVPEADVAVVPREPVWVEFPF